MEAMKQADPEGEFFFSVNLTTVCFQSLFVCPSASCSTSQNGCLSIIALDGTFTKNKFRQILLFAVSLDPNNEIVLLAWALMESESENSWRLFLGRLARYVLLLWKISPLIANPDIGLYSDTRT